MSEMEAFLEAVEDMAESPIMDPTFQELKESEMMEAYLEAVEAVAESPIMDPTFPEETPTAPEEIPSTSMEEATSEFFGYLVELDCGEEGTYQGIITEVMPADNGSSTWGKVKLEKPSRNGVPFANQKGVAIEVPGELIKDIKVLVMPDEKPESNQLRDGFVPVKKVAQRFPQPSVSSCSSMQSQHMNGIQFLNRFQHLPNPLMMPMNDAPPSAVSSSPYKLLRSKKILTITPPPDKKPKSSNGGEKKEKGRGKKEVETNREKEEKKLKKAEKKENKKNKEEKPETKKFEANSKGKDERNRLAKEKRASAKEEKESKRRAECSEESRPQSLQNVSRPSEARQSLTEPNIASDAQTILNFHKMSITAKPFIPGGIPSVEQKKKILTITPPPNEEPKPSNVAEKKEAEHVGKEVERNKEKEVEKLKEKERKESDSAKEEKPETYGRIFRLAAFDPIELDSDSMGKEDEVIDDGDDDVITQQIANEILDETEKQPMVDGVAELLEKAIQNIANLEIDQSSETYQNNFSESQSSSSIGEAKAKPISADKFVGSLASIQSEEGTYQGRIAGVDPKERTIKLEKPLLDGVPLGDPYFLLESNKMKDIKLFEDTSESMEQEDSPPTENYQSLSESQSSSIDEPKAAPISANDVGSLVSAQSEDGGIYQGKIAGVDPEEGTIKLEKPMLNGIPLRGVSYIALGIKTMKDIKLFGGANNYGRYNRDSMGQEERPHSPHVFMQSMTKPPSRTPPSGKTAQFDGSANYQRQSPRTFVRRCTPTPPTPPAQLAHEAYGDYKKFIEPQIPTPVRLRFNQQRNPQGNSGPTGIPAMDCINGYNGYNDVLKSEDTMGGPLDHAALNTDFDFAGNLALFNKKEFVKQTEPIFHGLDTAGNNSRNYRNDENVLMDSSRVISWTNGRRNQSPKFNTPPPPKSSTNRN